MRSPRNRVTPALFLGAILAVPAAAQTDTTRVDSLRRYPLNPILVTAGWTPVQAANFPGAIAVVDALRLQAEAPQLAIDVLRSLPGSHVDEAAGPGGPAIVRLRGGEEVFTQVLVDGTPINDNGGFFDFQGFALSNLDRVEVARGPQSAVFGSSAVSGVVQFVTRAGTPGPLRSRASMEGGGAAEHGGSWRASAEAWGGSERVRYSAGAGAGYQRGFHAIAHDVESRDASLRVEADPAENWTLTGSLRRMEYDGHLPVRDGGASRVPLDPNARNDRQRTLAQLEAAWRPAARWRHRLRTASYHVDFLYQDRADGVSHPDFFVFDANFDFDTELSRLDVEYLGSYGGAADRFTAAWGASWQREELETEISGDFSGSDAFERDSRSAFAELRGTPMAGLHLVGALRAEAYEDLDTEITPRAGAVWEAMPGWLRLRASAGWGYKAPNLQEQYTANPFIVANPDLEPERSTGWELGAELTPARARIAVTYFHQDFRDLIRTVQLNETQQINRNLGRSRAHGLEWDARLSLSPRWGVGSEGAWVHTEVRDATGLDPAAFPVGEPLPGRPDVVTAAWVEGRPAARWTAALRGTWVGRQTVLRERFSGPRVELDGYFTTGARVAFQASPRAQLYAHAENLFDTQYETAFDRPGAPLTLRAGVRLGTLP